MFKNHRPIWIGMALVILALVVILLPSLRERVSHRFEDIRSQVKYFFNPPSEAIFLPTQQAAIDAIVNATMQAHAAAELTPSTTREAGSTAPGPTAPPTITPTPLPPTVNFPGIAYVDQRERWNYCAPANLTMALKFWGWKGDRDAIAKVVKPGENDPSKNFIDRGRSDVNVMPYELVDFVNNETEYRALYRYGGDVQMIKSLLAAGFPLIAEKGYYEKDYRGILGWLGHYQFITGYDDRAQELIVQDTWNDGPNFHIKYDLFTEGWRSFDFVFLVVYPADRETEVLNALGGYSDVQWAAQTALNAANRDVQSLSGIDKFFAWFAKGTSHVALQQYVDAATAYDQAFSVYASLGGDDTERPYRIMWYETGPYWAYYYSGRYQDVINLANTTLNKTISVPTLEESIYWRGLAEYALGDTARGVDDVRRSVYYNKNFQAGLAKLAEWSVGP